MDFQSAPELKPIRPKSSAKPVWEIILLVSILLIALVYYYYNFNFKHRIILFGTVFGIVFQCSRSCFIPAFGENTASYNGNLMKYIVISIAISAIGFAFLKSKGYYSLMRPLSPLL